MKLPLAFLIVAASLLAAAPLPAAAQDAQPAAAELLTLDESVAFSLEHNFDVKIAELDYKVEAANILYSEAIFDSFMTGAMSFDEDRRKNLSVFGSDLSRSTSFSGGVSTKLRSGTEVDVTVGDARDWTDTVFVTQNPAYTATG